MARTLNIHTQYVRLILPVLKRVIVIMSHKDVWCDSLLRRIRRRRWLRGKTARNVRQQQQQHTASRDTEPSLVVVVVDGGRSTDTAAVQSAAWHQHRLASWFFRQKAHSRRVTLPSRDTERCTKQRRTAGEEQVCHDSARCWSRWRQSSERSRPRVDWLWLLCRCRLRCSATAVV